jgi:hypothetical protein
MNITGFSHFFHLTLMQIFYRFFKNRGKPLVTPALNPGKIKHNYLYIRDFNRFIFRCLKIIFCGAGYSKTITVNKLKDS